MKLLSILPLALTCLLMIEAQRFEDTDESNLAWDESPFDRSSDDFSRGSFNKASSNTEDIEAEDDTQQVQQEAKNDIPGRFGRNPKVGADEVSDEQPEQPEQADPSLETLLQDSSNLNGNEDLSQSGDDQTIQETTTSQQPDSAPENDIMANDTETTSIAPTEAAPTETVLATDELTQSTLSWAKMPFVNKPIENPQRCIVLSLGKGPACLDPKSFGPNFNPSPIAT